MKRYLFLSIVVIFCFCLCTCGSLGNLSDLNTAINNLNTGAEIAANFAKVLKASEDFTPEQEYYIGRSVGAVILNQYTPYRNKNANDYINTVGQTLVLFSDRPEIFQGYHFLILDSEEINAFASPSGLVFVTRGLLKLSVSEDSVAAILAHEIGHVVEKHGIKAIQKARTTAAVTGAFVDSADQIGIMPLPELTATFKDSIEDIITKMVVNGYSREDEKAADAAAVDNLVKVGYDPRALIELLEKLDKSYTRGGLDFAKTHPDPKKRIDAIEKKLNITQYSVSAPREHRQARFKAFYKELGY